MPAVSADKLSVRVSPNGRYFVNGRGEPFFWLADSSWTLFANYPKAAAEAFLTDRARRGFTVMQATLIWWGEPNPANNDLSGNPPGPNCNGDLPWEESPAHLNEKYFKHVDYLLNYARDLGLVVSLGLASGYHINNSRAINETNAYAFAYWLGSRYRNQPNILWSNGGDREPFGFEAVYEALAKGLRDGDGGSHLMTYHACGWRSSSYYYHNAPWLDFNAIQTWTNWPLIYQAVSADYCMLPVKPVVLVEGAYEDGPEYPLGPITAHVVRKQAWWAFTAGGFFSYGQNQMWRMEPGWTETFDTPGAQAMTIYKQIATSRPWWQMIPDQGLFASGVRSERSLNTALRTVDRSCAILYISEPGHVLVNLDRMANRIVRAAWVNPQTAVEMTAGEFATGNRIPGTNFPRPTVQWFTTPPRWEDAVLILDGVE
jgi:hypothetical protein